MNIDLTHPEILTIEQLQHFLLKFIGSDVTNDRYELIQLFYKYIAPLPQRKFRTNRFGIILTNRQRQLLISNPEDTDKMSITTLKLPADGLNSQSQGEKYESDRGIYTVTMQKSGNKNTAPIKLKRPAPTITTTNDDQDATKRLKLDDKNT